MEKIEKNLKNNPDNDLDKFTKEMKRLKEEETGERKTAHFEEINPKNLTEEDKEIWHKYQSDNLTVKEFLTYQSNIPREEQDRKHFSAYIGNLLTVRMGTKQLEKMKEKENQE